MLTSGCEERQELLSRHAEALTSYLTLRSRRGRPTGESQRIFEEILRSFAAYQKHVQEHGCGTRTEVVTAGGGALPDSIQ